MFKFGLQRQRRESSPILQQPWKPLGRNKGHIATSEGNAQYTFDPYIQLEDIKVPDDINEFDWSSDLKKVFE
jgi:hypothetical protein